MKMASDVAGVLAALAQFKMTTTSDIIMGSMAGFMLVNGMRNDAIDRGVEWLFNNGHLTYNAETGSHKLTETGFAAMMELQL